jgi:dUTP pyrophosphatase
MKIQKTLQTAKIPTYGSTGAACFDIYSAVDVEVYPGETKLVRTGLIFDIPTGHEMQIRPRSGLSAKTELRIANAPGTIDSDYKKEVYIAIYNCGKHDKYKIKSGDRIAQGLVQKVEKTTFEVVEKIDDKSGRGGFGSTGV